MTGWQETTLGEIADINPTAISTSGGDRLIRYIDISSVDIGSLNAPPAQMFLKDAPSRARRLVQYGDSVLSTVRPNRKSRFFVRHDLADAVVSTGFAVLRPKNGKTDARYLYSIICDENFVSHLVANEKGAAYPAVTTDIIERYPLVLPPLPEQRAIAAVLGALDDKIELNRRMNATLEQMARALFKSWFVDFDPVRAKMEGKQPFGMDTATAALFPSGFISSSLGNIPEGWDVRKSSSILSRLSCTKHYAKEDVSSYGRIPVFEQGGGLLLGYHRDEALFKATKEDPIFIFGDHTCIMHLYTSDFDISSNVIPLKGKGFPTSWVYYAIKDKQKFQEYRRHWSELIIHDIVVPRIETAQFFSEKISGLLDKKTQLQFENQNLIYLRDYLLPKLISGDIRIPNAEKFVEAV